MKIIRKTSAAFTIVEIIIATVVAGLLSMIVVGFYVAHLRSYATSEVRNTATTDMQQALSIVSDDIRNARRVMTYNLVPDVHAPSTLQFAGSKGPATDTDSGYYWRSTSGQLVLERVPRDVSGAPLYDAPIEERLGKSDYVIYYVYQNDLYRRYVPTNAYASNRELPLSTCAVDAVRAPFGGCSTDQKVLSKLKTQGGSNGFDVRYLNKSGSEVLVKNPDGSPNYEYVGGAAGLSVSFNVSREGGGQMLNLSDKGTMMFRPLSTVSSTPPVVVTPDLPTVTYPSIVAGSGGLEFGLYSGVVGSGRINVGGRLSIYSSSVGSTANPVSVNIGNKGCGAVTDYPIQCANNQALTMGIYTGLYGGAICATGQTTNSFGSGVVVGLQLPCTAPEVTLPTFNKAAFTSPGYLTGGVKTGAQGSCNYFSDILVLPARTRYEGQLSMSNCQVVVEGDIYVAGASPNFTLSLYLTLKVSESLGCRRPTIVVNGKITITSSTIVPNSCGVTPRFISFLSSDNVCTNSDTCTSLSTAAHRFSSKDLIGVTNNMYSDANNAAFYAYFSKNEVASGAATGALAGHSISLSSAIIRLSDLGTGW